MNISPVYIFLKHYFPCFFEIFLLSQTRQQVDAEKHG